jgi:hypothetical protein
MSRARCIDESVFTQREHSSQQCLLPGTSAPCSGILRACYARAAAALMPAASPSRSARTMARSTSVPRRPARFPGPCADPARIPPQVHRSFERGFKPRIFAFVSCPAKCRMSIQFACFKVSIGTNFSGRVIVNSTSQIAFPREPKMAQMPIFVRRLGGVPIGRFPRHFVGSWSEAPLVDPEL